MNGTMILILSVSHSYFTMSISSEVNISTIKSCNLNFLLEIFQVLSTDITTRVNIISPLKNQNEKSKNGRARKLFHLYKI